MMVVLVLGMLLRVAILRMPMASGLSRQSINERYARRAAQSGLAVALTKLREDNSWPSMTSEPLEIQEPGVLSVEEKQGNVLGTITEPDGTISEFRIRFNYQNGNAGNDPDGLPDPLDPAMSFDTPYVSVNNLNSTEPAVVPRGVGANSKVKEPNQGHLIPEISVSLAVEGRTLGSHGQVLAKHVTEAVYVLAAKDQVDDAVIMAGGGLDIRLQNNGKLQLGAKKLDKSTPALSRLRSKQGLLAKANGSAAKLKLQQGRKVEFSYNSAQDNNVSQLLSQVPEGRASEVEEGARKDFYSLPSDSIKQATPGPNTVQLKAGTYVYAGLGDDRKLLYFDQNGEDFLNPSLGQRPDISLGLPVHPDLGNVLAKGTPPGTDRLFAGQASVPVGGTPVKGFRWTIKDLDVKIEPTEHSTGFTLIPWTETPFTDDLPRTQPVDLSAESPDRFLVNLNNTTISAPGDVTIFAGISGKSGTITSEGDVNILAGRQLKMEQESGSGTDTEPDDTDDPDEEAPREDRNTALQLNIYTEKNLNISTDSARLKEGKGGYRDLTFKGLLYSWGNVTVHAANPGETKRNGALTLKGSLVAYGNDPASGAPGGGLGNGSNGNVVIKAKNANLNWDPSFFNLAAVQGGSRNVGFSKYSVSFPKP